MSPYAALSDAELLRAYQRTTGEPGDQAADALLAEIGAWQAVAIA